MEQQHLNTLYELMVDTFRSLRSIEEGVLDNRSAQELTLSELHTIVAVGLTEENPMSVVASRLDVTLATLNVAIGKLEKKGFVEKRRCETDRRQMLIKLTAKGRKAYRAHASFHRALIEEALAELTPEEERVFESALVKVKSYFDERISEDK